MHWAKQAQNRRAEGYKVSVKQSENKWAKGDSWKTQHSRDVDSFCISVWIQCDSYQHSAKLLWADEIILKSTWKVAGPGRARITLTKSNEIQGRTLATVKPQRSGLGGTDIATHTDIRGVDGRAQKDTSGIRSAAFWKVQKQFDWKCHSSQQTALESSASYQPEKLTSTQQYILYKN